MRKVLMSPTLKSFRSHESGIRRVVEYYSRYLPKYGWEVVDGDEFDIIAVHAGTAPDPDVSHCHGLYWTADYSAENWAWKGNAQVIDGIRRSRITTVPSSWVQEVFQRDMRFSPTIVPHGVEWENIEPKYTGNFVLWNKNRAADVCDPTPVSILASRNESTNFVSTFSPAQLSNVRVTGLLPHHRMMGVLGNCSVYLATTKETFGIGTLEAMASGKPILGFAHGGILDIVAHKVNGYLAEPGNYDDLEHGLHFCLENMEMLGKNSRELVKRFSWDDALKIVAGLYDSCLVTEPVLCDIVIPVYNKSKESLSRAIASARDQSKHLGEIIVVDDGSEEELSKEYKDTCESMGVSFYRKENGGVATARNYGIARGTSKYVCCLDSDDAIHEDFLHACVDELENDRSIGIAYTGLWYVRRDGRQGLSRWPGEFNFDDQLQRKNQVPTCCVFRKEMWERLGGYKQRYAPTGAGTEDAEFWLRAGSIGYGAKKVTDAGLFIYSMGGGHTSENGYKEVDWTFWHPWTKDNEHPMASVATPDKFSHEVRQYDEPSISVIIPVGPGHENILIDALDSLEAQTIRKWEAIVVYDGTDDIPDWIRRSYPYIKIYKTGGMKGAGYARNVGVKKSRAPMLFFLDADDFISPRCLEEMLNAWTQTGNAVYTDYYGVSVVNDPSSLSRKIKIVSRDENTGESLLSYKAFDFDCDRALRQPENPPYIWSNVNVLMPRRWFNEIGGFDENMPSWEDVDLMWRLAWSGRCFQRINQPLMTYRFSSGSRRNKGLDRWDELLSYTKAKKETLNIMGKCGSCGGNKSVIPARSAAQQNLAAMRANSTQEISEMTDDNYVLCKYMHPNRGQHNVTGQGQEGGSKQWYGYRAHGDTFLVHKLDIRAQPHLFVPVDASVARGVSTNEPVPEPVQGFDAEAYLAKKREQWRGEAELDLQGLPGVTEKIANSMKASGFTTKESIVSAGAKTLQESVKGIGEAKAEMIVAYLESL